MPTILVKNHSFHFKQAGQQGDPLIFLSGLGGDHRAFSLAQRHFGHLHRTFGFDARDVGRSDRFSDSYTTAAMADDVAGWLEAIAVPAAHIVGHSLGGLVAQELALRHPDKVRSLVLASTHAGADTWRKAVIESWVVLRRRLAVGLFTRATLPWLVRLPFMTTRARSRAWFVLPSRTPGPRMRRLLPGRPMPPPSMMPGQVSERSTCLASFWSANSIWLIHLAWRLSLPRALSDSRMVVLPRVGHLPHIEDRAAFHEAVSYFINQVSK